MEGSSARKRPGFAHNKRESHLFVTHPYSTNSDSAELSQPRKLNGSIVETPSHQDLHRELLLSHKRGLVLEEKPELKRVLEQRRLELHREEEQAQRRPSDLEKELRKRQQKLQEPLPNHSRPVATLPPSREQSEPEGDASIEKHLIENEMLHTMQDLHI